MKTCTLATAEADIVYDVQGPLPTADGRPPLVHDRQPMDASGFRADWRGYGTSSALHRRRPRRPPR